MPVKQRLCHAYETEQVAASISYVVMGIFGPTARTMNGCWRWKMACFLTGDEKYRDLIYDDDFRSYLVSEDNSLGDYRFGRTHGKHFRVRARSALRRANGYLKGMIEAVASAKLRRMERRLRLRRVRSARQS